MEAVLIYFVVVGLIAWHVYDSQQWRAERKHLLAVVTAEKAPTFTRIEQLKETIEDLRSIEPDDDGDYPEGAVF